MSAKEQAFQNHEKNVDSEGHHPDGCFYCGGGHPSDCCPDAITKDEYWNGKQNSTIHPDGLKGGQ